MSFIKFLGTAGARFVMIKQLRSSGGIWLSHKGTNLIIDPGPGAIVRVNSVRPKLDLATLSAVILTHKHLDHTGDVNVMIEAMTEGGFKKRGVLFVPRDALGIDGVVYRYHQRLPQRVELLSPGKKFICGDLTFKVATRNRHSVATYGLKFELGAKTVGFVSDTAYFPQLGRIWRGCDVLVVNVVFMEPRPKLGHLALEEAVRLVKAAKPKLALFTHFGMGILKNNPQKLEKALRKKYRLPIRFAHDGLTVRL